MALKPVFATTPRISSVTISTVETSLTAPTNFGTVIAGVAAGTRVAEIVVKCAATSTAGLVRIFLHNGTSYYLFDEIVVAAATSSASVATTRVSTSYNNLVLPDASWTVRATTSVAQAIVVTAFGADL
jgi:hypothetical protein